MSRRERRQQRKRERIDFIPWPAPSIPCSTIGDSVGHGVSMTICLAHLRFGLIVPPGRDHLTEELVDYISRQRN